MMTMDSAARAIDAMLHRGRAEERDGGVWLDDLAARELGDCTMDEYGTPWREAAQEWEREHDRVERLNDGLIVDRDHAFDALHDIMRLLGIPRHPKLPVGTVPHLPDHPIIELLQNRLTEWRDEVSDAG